MRKKLIKFYTFAVPVLIVGLAITIPGCKLGKPEQQAADLVFWGVFDDFDVYKPLIEKFNTEFPNINISYAKKDYQTYEDNLLETMAAGTGPDILMIHNTWLPRYINRLVAAPTDLITFKDVQNNFVDVAASDFVSEGYIMALPLSVDTLALYYNKDIFNTKGIPQPPATWEEFLEAVETLTTRNEQGDIVFAGAAIGTANNVNRAVDILCLLMIQSGVQMVDDGYTQATFHQPIAVDNETFYLGERALEFYTNFSNSFNSVYTWNNQLDYSLDAFARGQAGMMFNYAYNIPTIKSQSPFLNFGVAPMPQIKTAQVDVNYANYWGLAVSRTSKSSAAAWQFINWLTQPENMQLYAQTTNAPVSRRDLITWQQGDPDLGVFSKQALTAYSWYQADNNVVEQSFANMIESVVGGKATIKEAVIKAADEITSTMRE